jgi:alkylated DNA nucleotide flippase Atl1
MAERSVAFDNMRRALLAYVQAIPFAAVVEVQAIAGALNIPARHAAYILSRLSIDETDLCPWHRVVPRNGVFSGGRKSSSRTALQIALLRHEGVPFANDVSIDFGRATLWRPPDTYRTTCWADYEGDVTP